MRKKRIKATLQLTQGFIDELIILVEDGITFVLHFVFVLSITHSALQH